MDWLLKRQFLSKACIPIRQYITRDRVAYTPAQECGLRINTACSHHKMPQFSLFSFFSLFFFLFNFSFLTMGLLNGLPQSAHPRVQFAEAGCCRTIGLQWRSENLIQHLEFHEKKLNNEGAYECFLTKKKS